nr:hypothetical protein [Tanacetum cinerariifolium]
MHQKIKQLQAQLGDLKEFQVFNYARENAHLKDTHKNLFDSIYVSCVQTETRIASLQNELQSNIYKNAKLRTQLFKKVSDQKENTQDSSKNTKFAKQPNVEILPKIGETNALSKPVTSNFVSTPPVSKGVNNAKVIALGMFRINPSQTSKEEKQVPNTVSASARTKPITVSQPPVITKKNVNSNVNGLSSTGVDNTKTRRPQPRSNTKNDRVPSASKSKLVAPSKSESHVNCYNGDNACNSNAMEPKIKRFLNSTSLLGRNLEGVDLLKGDRSTSLYTINLHEMASASPICLMARASSTKSWLWHQRLSHLNFDTINELAKNDLVVGNLKLLINFVWKFMGTVCFGNDHVAAIMGFEVELRRNAYSVRNLEGVDLLKGDRSTNLYTINLHEMTFASPICLMARASSTKTWLWHQRLSHLTFDTINDFARNDLVAGLPKFRYHKEHLFPSCEKGKSKRASHPPKPVPNSRQRLHLLHMDLCGP